MQRGISSPFNSDRFGAGRIVAHICRMRLRPASMGAPAIDLICGKGKVEDTRAVRSHV